MISGLDRAALRAEARAFFGLDADRPTLVVTGGSQGARNINNAVSGAARALGDAGVQVLHVVGPKNDVVPQAGVPTYVPIGYVDRMDYALAAADLMVCRGGASSVTEAAAVGVPAIFVPLPIGNGEQVLQRPAGRRRRGSAAGRRRRLHRGVGDRERAARWSRTTDRLAAMSAAASALIPRDADEKLARIVLETGTMKVSVPDELLPADRLGHVHFVGIGGAGLSAIARIMLARGIAVSGSDGVDSPTLDALRALGARVHVGHAADQLGDADTVVVSTAVREDNPEYAAALGPRPAGAAAVGGPGRGDGRPPGARRRRHARQDHDHRAAHRRPAGRRRGPDVRHRRRPGRHRHQRRPRGPATCSSPRPTRATAPSCTTRRTPRSSRTSRPTTSTTG